MPNRERIAKVLTEDVLGYQQWNGRLGKTVNMPVEDWEEVNLAMEAVVERVAQAADWPRLLEEATMRHGLVHPDKPVDDRRITPRDVCGECLREALLQDRTGAPAWHEQESTPLRHNKTDWPTVVMLKRYWREQAHGHPYSED